MGTIGYKIFGVVLLAASVSSVIGAAYTSVTFMYSLHDSIRRHNQRVVIAFIACSTLIYSLVGQPVKVLVVAGTLNALVLPLALGCILLASRKTNIVRSEEHTSELQSLMRISYAAFCLKKKITD